jgi:hypothetical protein
MRRGNRAFHPRMISEIEKLKTMPITRKTLDNLFPFVSQTICNNNVCTA